MLRTSLASLVALAVASIATTARADEPDADLTPAPSLPSEAPDAPAITPHAHDDLLLTAGVGVLSDEHRVGGLLTATALRQHGLLGYGATFEYGGAVFDYTTYTAAPMVGIFVEGPRWLRVGVAAAGGIHHYDHVGSGFISSTDPGASGTTAFLGGRAFLGAEAGGKTRFHVGLQLALDDDLTRARNAYTYQESAWTSPHSVTTSHTVGSLRFAGMLALGTAFDL
jgi:hypothetical protein